MVFYKCPGQDSRKLKVEIIKCSNCGYEIEFFSDELKRKCPKCKKDVFRENMPSCIEWCIYAEKCVGESYYKKYMKDKRELIKEKILKRVEEIIPEKMEIIKTVLKFIEEMVSERDPVHIIIPASILYFLDNEEKRRILNEFEFKKEDIDKICNPDRETYSLINDAVLLARKKIGENVELNQFLTEKGRKIYEGIL
jgi:anaerobic ribonucleoside-triphosphate reductase